VPVYHVYFISDRNTIGLLAVQRSLGIADGSPGSGRSAAGSAPTVLGFYLLIMLGPRGFVGGTLESIGLKHLAFSFEGILIGSVLYSMPFAVQPLLEAFNCPPASCSPMLPNS
jgi:hypothetical protein